MKQRFKLKFSLSSLMKNVKTKKILNSPKTLVAIGISFCRVIRRILLKSPNNSNDDLKVLSSEMDPAEIRLIR